MRFRRSRLMLVMQLLILYALGFSVAPTAESAVAADARARQPVSGPGGSGANVAAPSLFYTNNFEGHVGPEWSHVRVSASPNAERTFLGPFGNVPVSLTLTGLPPRSSISVSFDLLLIGAWGQDAEDCCTSKTWKLTSGDGMSLLDTSSFSGLDWSGFGGQPRSTTARGLPSPSETDTLGYARDSVHPVEILVADEDGELRLTFSASNLVPASGEGWGLDNVRIGVPTGGMTINQLGRCPGESEFRILGAPLGSVAIGGARQAGDTTLPGGPCAGTIVNLQRPILLGTLPGSTSIRIDIPDAACGGLLQALSLSSCTTSNVEPVVDHVTIAGQVVDGDSGTPIPGALVSTSLDTETATTDGGGQFELLTDTAGDYCCTPYTIFIDAPGYIPFAGTFTWGGHPVGQLFGLFSEISCGVGLTECFGQCVNLMTDEAHCGSCGFECLPSEYCNVGECIEF